jgi:thiopeptide-type bacteriocin biosynthesis protein
MKTKSMSSLDKVILREPVLPFDVFFSIPSGEKDLTLFVKNLFKNTLFKEGVFLASPELFYEWEKFCNDYFFNEKKHSRLIRSILKYYIRALSNPTPFGLFSTYSIIKKDINTYNEKHIYDRYSSIDMSFLSKLVNQLNKNEEVKSKLKYYPNNTSYFIGEEIRYIEQETENDLSFKLSTLKKDEVIKFVLQQVKEGMFLEELKEVLLHNIEGVEENEIKLYIEELISSQIIRSSLEICLNDIAPLKQLLNFFENNLNDINTDYVNTVFSMLKELDRNLSEIDKKVIGNSISEYENIIMIAKKSKLSFNQKYLVNSDLKKVKHHKNIDVFGKDQNNINKAIEVLSLFTPKEITRRYVPNRNLDKFIEAYIKRYENREMPLLSVIDNVTGIGYIQDDNDFNSFSNVIDDISFNEIGSTENLKFSSNKKIDTFWFQVILQALKNNNEQIDLKCEDLSSLEKRDKKFFGTFSVLYSKIKEKISLLSVGSSTALHYIGRFTYNDLEMKKFGDEIVVAEEKLFPNKILAEILHLPATRAGNISIRNINRKHEISILSKSSGKNKTIKLSNILISIVSGKIILRDKNRNKEIIPFLSCAQNYHSDTLPMYHLLCDLQSQYRSNILDLHLNNIFYQYFDHIPRIVYGEDIVLFTARWVVSFSDLDKLNQYTNKTELLDKFYTHLKKKQIPRLISLLENDREPILLDLENTYMLTWLFEELEKKKRIIITEFLFDEDNPSEFYNEYLMSFCGESTPEDSLQNVEPSNIKRSFIPYDEWVYFKIFTGINIANKVLSTIIKPIVETLIEKEIIDHWFFIRYKDPDFHLRVRFHLKSSEKKGQAIEVFNQYLKKNIDNGIIWKIELSTYERELERYHGKCIEESEKIFSYDSSMVVGLLKLLKQDKNENYMWLYCLKSIDAYFNLFGFTIEEKYLMLEAMYKSISVEFNSNKKIRVQIDKKFREHSTLIKEVMEKEDLYSELIRERDSYIKSIIYPRLVNESRYVIKDLISSYIHMTVNRFITSNSGMHELVFYGVLEKFYKKEKGLKKYKVTSTV